MNEPLILSPANPVDSARQLLRYSYTDGAKQTLWHQQSTFFAWTGTHYREAAHEEVKAVVYQFLDGSVRQDGDGKLVPFSPNRARVGDVLDALSAVTQLPHTVSAPAWFGTQEGPPATEIVACSNGLLHLPTRRLMAHTAAFFGLNAVGYHYDETAPDPVAWLDFLRSLWPDDPETIDTLQEIFGLLLTNNTAHQKAFLAVGPKRSGKGTIARILTALLGKDNVAGPTLSSLSQNFGLSPLIGKPLAVVSDARLGGRTDANIIAERLLSITGEDGLTIDRKFREAWTGRLPTRFLILSNELPRLTDASGALASRFIVLRLNRSFYGQEDHDLTKKLTSELPAILLWAMNGRDRLAQRGHFIQPASGAREVEELEDLGSPVLAFLRQRCLIGTQYAVEADQMFNAWLEWCRENGRDRPGTKQTFGRDLNAAVPGLSISQPRDAATKERLRFYQGVGLAL